MLLTVDTLAFAVADTSLVEVMDFLMLDICDFDSGKAFNRNYTSSLYLGGIRIGYNNFTSRYSVYVYMSGQGCRSFESYHSERIHSFDWFDFICSLFSLNSGIEDPKMYKVSFRRIDIACDDRSGGFDIPLLAKYFEQHKIAGNARTFKYTLGSEESFYAGSPSSDHFIRIYNKLLERGFSKDEGDPWIRVEWQLRDDHAYQFIQSWISSGDLASVFCGYTLDYLRFLKKPNDRKNSQRIEVAQFWLDFLHSAERIKFVSKPGVEYNLKKLERFINFQVASSIQTFILTHSDDPEELLRYFLRDDVKLNKEQQKLIRTVFDIKSFKRAEQYLRDGSSELFYQDKVKVLKLILGDDFDDC